MRRIAAIIFVLALPLWLLLGGVMGAACSGMGTGAIVRDLWRAR